MSSASASVMQQGLALLETEKAAAAEGRTAAEKKAIAEERERAAAAVLETGKAKAAEKAATERAEEERAAAAKAAEARAVREEVAAVSARVASSQAARDEQIPVEGNPQLDMEYVETHGVKTRIATALSHVIRERPAAPLRRIAQLVAPETYSEGGAGDGPLSTAGADEPVATGDGSAGAAPTPAPTPTDETARANEPPTDESSEAAGEVEASEQGAPAAEDTDAGGMMGALSDREWMDQFEVEKAIATALATLLREKPGTPLHRLAQLLSPETYVAYVPPPPTTAEGTADEVDGASGAPEEEGVAGVAADAAVDQDAVTDGAPEGDTPTVAAAPPA